jgi:hypothetical protein
MEKFTQGKWIVKSENDGSNIYIKDATNTAAICKLYTQNAIVLNKEEAVANAKLIASAPELLEALKAVFKSKTERGIIGVEEMSLVINAINKATL